MPLSSDIAQWAARVSFDDLPADVVTATRFRVLDVIGLALAGADTPFGRSVRGAAVAMSSPGPCRVFGTRDSLNVTLAAFANGAFSQALEYDDTHNESIVHMSSPSVAAALAIADTSTISGRDLMTAIAVGNEISCRVGSVAPGQFHRRGFHPSGLFATFGVAYLAGRLLRLDADAMARAAGICGSFASGILECWVDGTQTKFLHPGWSAQSGIASAFLAAAGTTGPAEVFATTSRLARERSLPTRDQGLHLRPGVVAPMPLVFVEFRVGNGVRRAPYALAEQPVQRDRRLQRHYIHST